MNRGNENHLNESEASIVKAFSEWIKLTPEEQERVRLEDKKKLEELAKEREAIRLAYMKEHS